MHSALNKYIKNSCGSRMLLKL